MAGKDAPKKPGKGGGQMLIAIVVTVVAAVIIFGGGAYLFTRLFTGSFSSFGEENTIQLEATEYKNTIEVAGTVRSTSGEAVSPEVDGTVSELSVKEGDTVKKGDVLFTMKNETLVKSVETSQKSYDAALDSQSKAQEAYDKAVANVKKATSRKNEAEKSAKKAYQDELKAFRQAQASSEDEGEEGAQGASAGVAEPEYSFDSSAYDTSIEIAQDSQDSAKTALDNAKASVETAADNLAEAQRQVELLDVKAPREGTVADLRVEKGTSASAINTAGYALRIIDLKTLVGAVEVPESSVSSVSVGQDCVVTAGSGSDAFQVNASVYKVADTPVKKSKKDEDGVKYAVQLTLDDTSGKIKYGMSITAAIELRDFGTVFYVPASAVGENGTGAYVDVVYNDNTTKEHSVTVIDTTDDGRAIIQGNMLNKDMRIRSDLS